MNDQEWARIVRLVVRVLAVALAMIPAALDVGPGREPPGDVYSAHWTGILVGTLCPERRSSNAET